MGPGYRAWDFLLLFFTCHKRWFSCWPPEKHFLAYHVLPLVCREQLAESILHEGSTGCRVVEKFLKILQVVVQEPGQVFKPFLPSIISLCMEQVYPIIAEVRGAGPVPCADFCPHLGRE